MVAECGPLISFMRPCHIKALVFIQAPNDFTHTGLDLGIRERIVQILRSLSCGIMHDRFRKAGVFGLPSSHRVPQSAQRLNQAMHDPILAR
jgi:hypothetical protein